MPFATKLMQLPDCLGLELYLDSQTPKSETSTLNQSSCIALQRYLPQLDFGFACKLFIRSSDLSNTPKQRLLDFRREIRYSTIRVSTCRLLAKTADLYVRRRLAYSD